MKVKIAEDEFVKPTYIYIYIYIINKLKVKKINTKKNNNVTNDVIDQKTQQECNNKNAI